MRHIAITGAVRSSSVHRLLALVCLAIVACTTREAAADALPIKGTLDSRIRFAPYSPEQVYQLYGYVGYQIDLQFESGETFVGLAAGDIEGIGFVAQDNHLFLKPKAATIGTNLTVLTSRRHYQFDYSASARRPDVTQDPVIYAVRFTYPPAPAHNETAEIAKRTDEALAHASEGRPRNVDYWFCGNPAVKPIAASDDGVHTRLRFDPKAELPALFVRNEDGSESLLNFSMDEGDVVIHRVARQFVLRRGKLVGCVLNQHFEGGGDRLESNTMAPEVERKTKGLEQSRKAEQP
jgi:type IV secretion system protein VirB9